MRKISILFAVLAAGVAFTACDETKDDNPVLRTHEGQPQVDFLNVPSLQNMYIDLTEDNKQDNLHLTCSQPAEYGLATTVNYLTAISNITARYPTVSPIAHRSTLQTTV